ncbi:MAG TPA: DUF6797 domain-containing protein, partial [Tepidisphaeraceae bacterium]|nr:DUF6797 domain-containing protein [Tepidisphaeraceae bacterium]
MYLLYQMPRTAVTLCLVALCLGATTKPATRPAMDYGSFLSYSVIAPWDPDKLDALALVEAPKLLNNPIKPKNTDLVLKGINIKLDNTHTICFDTDLMRWAGAWSGGFLDLSKTHQILLKGTHPPSVDGELMFTTPMRPGLSPKNNFQDPRPDQMGPLPRDFAHYKGLYLHGSDVVLSFTVGDAQFLELPTIVNNKITIQTHVTLGEKKSISVFPIESIDYAVNSDLPSLTKGGPARYQPLTTKGT